MRRRRNAEPERQAEAPPAELLHPVCEQWVSPDDRPLPPDGQLDAYATPGELPRLAGWRRLAQVRIAEARRAWLADQWEGARNSTGELPALSPTRDPQTGPDADLVALRRWQVEPATCVWRDPGALLDPRAQR